MSDVLLIDNFERAHGLPENTVWLRAFYAMFNQFSDQSYAAPTTSADGHPALSLVGRSASLANWGLGVPTPTPLGTFTLGLRVHGVPTASRGTGGLGIVGDPGPTAYSTILSMELTPTGLTIHYRDSTGPQAVPVPITWSVDGVYLDWTFHKISEVPNEMSQFTLMVDNFPAFSGPVFNNAGTNLIMAFAGTLPTAPGPADPGFLNHVQITDTFETNLGYTISDLWVTRNGKRFGKPVVESQAIQTLTTDLQSSEPELTVEEILNTGPLDWQYAQGQGTTTATFPGTGETAQVRTVLETQDDQDLRQVTLIVGQDQNDSLIYWTPSAVSVVTDSPADTAVLEIHDA